MPVMELCNDILSTTDREVIRLGGMENAADSANTRY